MSDSDWLAGRYEVLRTISTGRRASVFQALDHVHDRLVAIKVYPVVDGDRASLLAEAHLLINLAPHPALPVVRGDFFTDDGASYVIVMNWIDGKNLQQILDEDGDPGLPMQGVIADLAQAAEALDRLHAYDPAIVHGDVKPANLVRAADGHTVLVDFDVAGAQAGRGPVGTLGFVAPEVAAGEKPQPTSDVYGLAATAIALLTGRPPTDGTPMFSEANAAQQSRLARVLWKALATDPLRRPSSAGKLIEQLRAALRVELPSGVVAFLATEVEDAGRLWDEEPEEMHSAMIRLRDVRDEIVQRRGGQVVTSMNEGDRSIIVFAEVSAAALAALDLHDGLAREAFPPGIDVVLSAAVVVGESRPSNGVYSGVLVDHLLRLRSIAEPGTTITSEATAELLVGLVGRNMSIVALATVAPSLPAGTALFALTRPGAEPLLTSVAAPTAVATSIQTAVVGRQPVEKVSRRAVAVEAIEHPVTLGALMVAGLGVIFDVVLAAELGMEMLGTVALAAGALGFVASFGWRYSTGIYEQRSRLTATALENQLTEQARTVAQDRTATRRRLEQGFSAVRTNSGAEGAQALHGLAMQFDSIDALVRRSSDRPASPLPSVLPHLSEEAYRHGMSALSDALELLESAEGPTRRRLEAELDDIEDRLAADAYADERARSRDEQRLATHQQLLARLDESGQRAHELMFEAERCTTALAEAHLELTSVRAGDTQVDVDAVVQTLQHTIRRVREVQDEFRRLGH